MPVVFNKKTDSIPEDAVYVGRPSKWGNPFKLKANRSECVECYRQWLLRNPRLLADLHELRGKDLVCWCAPLACHADVLLELANK